MLCSAEPVARPDVQPPKQVLGPGGPLAVTSMACRVPGAEHPAEFWAKLQAAPIGGFLVSGWQNPGWWVRLPNLNRQRLNSRDVCGTAIGIEDTMQAQPQARAGRRREC